MCKHGTTVNIMVTIPASHSSTGKIKHVMKPIDSCIVDIVEALEDSYIFMTGSCCGHGKRDGEILLADGRKLIIKQ